MWLHSVVKSPHVRREHPMWEDGHFVLPACQGNQGAAVNSSDIVDPQAKASRLVFLACFASLAKNRAVSKCRKIDGLTFTTKPQPFASFVGQVLYDFRYLGPGATKEMRPVGNSTHDASCSESLEQPAPAPLELSMFKCNTGSLQILIFPAKPP